MKIKSRYVLNRDDINEMAGLIDVFVATCPDEAGGYDCERLFGAMMLLKDSMCLDDGLVIDGGCASIEHGVTKE